jgi:indolepyruvate ferredoxin oxidoreductase alpha subunit
VIPIENVLKGLGIKWIKRQHTFRVGKMAKLLREALTTPVKGLKVIIAEAECQLAKQRRLRPLVAKALNAGKRVVRTRFGVDEDTCTGDHACIRLSGCPSLTVKPNPDKLRKDPVTTVIDSCVGCGLCGEVADAAVLCPSFYRAEIIQNPNPLDRMLDGVRQAMIGALQGRANGSGAAV